MYNDEGVTVKKSKAESESIVTVKVHTLKKNSEISPKAIVILKEIRCILNMVWQQALYLVNLLCKFVPCDYSFPYPDTSVSEPQAFKNHISIGFDDSLNIGGWGKHEDEPHAWLKEHDYTLDDPLAVITTTGKLRGYWMRVVGGRKIRAFEGIPYAEPPVGYFRFDAPAPKISWTGLLHATKKGQKCLQFSQIDLHKVVGSEDCLCLNIYTPQIPKGPGSNNKTRFPVIVYIHGGGFQVGSGNDYGPSYLLQQDLILVTFNWRVGVFGFMSTGDSFSTGNYGLKDQAVAIKWVHDNIEYFNGDPTRITLFGQEAGGASVHLQMIASMARPYFHGGVSMSGSAFSPWVFHTREKAHELTKYFAKKFHCPVHSSEAIVSCLRRVDAHELAKTQIKFLDDWPMPIYLFRPVLEEDSIKYVPFLTETPEEIYKKGNVARLPWITGFTEDEGLTFLLPIIFRGTIKALRSNWNHLAADFLDYEHLKHSDSDEITRKINWLYFKKDGPLTASIKTFSDALSMRFTITGAHKGLQAHCQMAPTYGYMFSYNGRYNLGTMGSIIIKPNEWGVGQGEDVFYLFNSTKLYQGFQKLDHELILSKIMVNLFGNFASKGYPTFTLENHEDFQIWNPITDPRNMSFLLIHKKIKMIPEPYLKQTIYWESIGLPDSLPLINSTDHSRQYNHTLPKARFSPKESYYMFSTPDIFDLDSVTTPAPVIISRDSDELSDLNDFKLTRAPTLTFKREPSDEYDFDAASTTPLPVVSNTLDVYDLEDLKPVTTMASLPTISTVTSDAYDLKPTTTTTSLPTFSSTVSEENYLNGSGTTPLPETPSTPSSDIFLIPKPDDEDMNPIISVPPFTKVPDDTDTELFPNLEVKDEDAIFLPQLPQSTPSMNPVVVPEEPESYNIM